MAHTVVQMVKKYNLFNVGEKVSLPEHKAAEWCGEDNPRFKVAVRVPGYESKSVMEAPINKMVADTEDDLKKKER
jgi:hypothetical protein